jgi:hypothetical protein
VVIDRAGGNACVRSQPARRLYITGSTPQARPISSGNC